MTRLSWLCGSIIACVAVVACSSSSGSGVTETKRLTDLSASEQDKLCTYSVDVEDGPRTVTCSDKSMVTIDDKATCLGNFGSISAQCQATVSDAEKCFQAMGKDPCNLDVGACSALLSCIFQ